jgi:uncharacterized membrane protein
MTGDERLARAVGALLRAGVLLAAAVVLLGLVPYLIGKGGTRHDYSVFQGEPRAMRSVPGIVRDAVVPDSLGWMQLGILLLVATPVARVFLCLVGFAIERDRLYVSVTVVVLAALACSLLGVAVR